MTSVLPPLSRENLQRMNDAAVADFLVSREEERLLLYRDHLRLSVRYASPILVDALRAEGVPLGDVVAMMSPPPDWPRRLGAMRWPSSHIVGPGHLARIPGTYAERMFARRLRYGGALLRPHSHPQGAFAVWVSGDALFARIDLGRASLLLSGGDAFLRLPPGLPDSSFPSLAGQPLDRLVDHPLLNGRYCMIRSVHQRDPEAPPTLSFRCGLVRIDLLRAPKAAA